MTLKTSKTAKKQDFFEVFGIFVVQMLSVLFPWDVLLRRLAKQMQMLETLPEMTQNQVVEHLRHYIAELNDDLEWDSLFERTGPQLLEAVRRAKKEIVDGRAAIMDHDRL